MKVRRKTLILVAGIVWMVAGFNVARIGVAEYREFVSLFNTLLSCSVFILFGTMFFKVSKKHIGRILNYTEEKYLIFRFFDLKSYGIMIFMMTGGMYLRYSGLVSLSFIAVFYTGLGFALVFAGSLFIIAYKKNIKNPIIRTPLTQKSMEIAYEAHKGQMDKGGKPYIEHPLHVAGHMRNELSVCVALLHDVLEDSHVSIEDLRFRGIPEDALEALHLLTHKKEDTYEVYVRQLASNAIAKEVKIADLCHNSDLSRIPTVTQKDLDRIQKYKKALEFLREIDHSKGKDEMN